jgi:hypothetical protein
MTTTQDMINEHMANCHRSQVTKLDALRILSNAWHYLFPTTADQDALDLISDKFGYVRRSMTLLDLAPNVYQQEAMVNEGGWQQNLQHQYRIGRTP